MAADAGLQAIGTRFGCLSHYEAGLGMHPHARLRCEGADEARDGR